MSCMAKLCYLGFKGPNGRFWFLVDEIVWILYRRKKAFIAPPLAVLSRLFLLFTLVKLTFLYLAIIFSSKACIVLEKRLFAFFVNHISFIQELNQVYGCLSRMFSTKTVFTFRRSRFSCSMNTVLSRMEVEDVLPNDVCESLRYL